MTEGMFAAPSVMGIEWAPLLGRLLAIFPYGREVVITQYGEGACIRADVYDVDAGKAVALDALVFGKALVRQAGGVDPGKAVLGRLSQGSARGGQNPPWILLDPTAEDFARARDYFTANPARATLKFPSTPAPAPVPQPQYQPPVQQAGQPAGAPLYQPPAPPAQPGASPYGAAVAPPAPPAPRPVPYRPDSYPTPAKPQGEPPF